MPLSAVSAQRPSYPPSTKSDVVETQFGVAIADPYRWLEDLTSAQTKGWVEAQRDFSSEWLRGLPQREAIRARLTALWNYPRVTVPQRLSNGVLFYQRNSGLQRQYEVVARSSAQTGGRVVLDPNALSPEGTIALAQYSPSPDGRYVAYALAEGGADWEDIKVRVTKTGQDLPETLKWVRFSGLSWTRDGKGFFYSRYPARDESTRLSAALEHHALFYHRVGSSQAEDVLVYERRDLPTWFVFSTVSEDGRFLFVYLSRGADIRNRLYVAELGDPRKPNVEAPIRPLVETDDGEFAVLGTVGRQLYIRTDLDAPKKRVVAIDLDSPQRAAWRTIIPEGAAPIAEVALTSRALVVHRMVDVTSELTQYGYDGRRLRQVALPGPGSVTSLSASATTASFYYGFTSHLTPHTVYRYDGAAHRSTPFEPAALRFRPEEYETRRVWATSKDGTRVPLFVSAKRGLVLDGSHPTMLYAYGGFSVTIAPTFSPAALGWMEMGGVYATASVRGGAEYGESWHRAGMLGNKQNVFDDFLAAAEYVVKEGWTSPQRLVINGASNGGLLVGAAMTQRPDLFAVAIPQVGVLDMLRYHKFTGGAAWASEYGSPDEEPAFKWLAAYSPLHRLKSDTCYPATLVTTADHDDRVVPSHSYKFAAALQTVQGCDKPILLRVETQGSHGYRPTDKQIDEYADLWAFAWSFVGKK